ncbi:transposase, partial [Porphyromonas levii]
KEMHQRNEVEGTFGTVKMRYGAARIRTRLPETTEVAVAMSFLVKNVITFLRELIRIILSLLFPSFFSPKLQMVRQYPACISILQK